MGKQKEITIGDYALRARKSLFMSQREFADYMQIDQANVSRIENGKRNLPKDKIQYIAGELGLEFVIVSKAWLRFSETYGGEVQ
jgi:transcriptional regulator with XRE-family HTH domain